MKNTNVCHDFQKELFPIFRVKKTVRMNRPKSPILVIRNSSSLILQRKPKFQPLKFHDGKKFYFLRNFMTDKQVSILIRIQKHSWTLHMYIDWFLHNIYFVSCCPLPKMIYKKTMSVSTQIPVVHFVVCLFHSWFISALTFFQYSTLKTLLLNIQLHFVMKLVHIICHNFHITLVTN